MKREAGRELEREREIYIYIYIHTYLERERKRQGEETGEREETEKVGSCQLNLDSGDSALVLGF